MSSYEFAHEAGYEYLNIEKQLSNILSKSIIMIYSKIFIKTSNLAYFSRLIQYNKVKNHGTKLLKVQLKKRY